MIEAVERDTQFSSFYANRYDRAARLGYLLTGSKSVGEELAQDAFVQHYRRWDAVEHPSAWLRAAIVSGSRTWWRRARRSLPATPGPSTAEHSDAIAVRDALGALAPRARTALVLRYFEDLPEREIAALMDCPVGTVKSLIHRGLRSMEERLR